MQSLQEFAAAHRRLVDGMRALSTRQFECLQLLQHPNKQIARVLGISEGSVNVHLGVLYRKTRRSRRELIAAQAPYNQRS